MHSMIKNRMSSINIIKYLMDCLCVLSLVICVLSCISLLTTGKISVLNYRFLYIASPSMEPVLTASSIVLAKIIKDESEIKQGDICTYIAEDKLHTITHRIVEIREDGYIFKGDNNAERDDGLVSFDRILYMIIAKP